MKKRVKLFTTIASLCLAVALMAFGVYAATNLSFNVSNTVSFTATALVRAKVWHETSTTKCTASTPLANTTEAAPFKEYNGSESTGTELPIGDVTLTATTSVAEQMTYSYTIYIKNMATSNDSNQYLKVVVTGKTVAYAAADGYGIETTYKKGESAATATVVLAAGESMSYTVTITIDNAHTIPTKTDLGTSVELTAQATESVA